MTNPVVAAYWFVKYKNTLNFGIFRELQDKNYFRQAKVLVGTVVWPHEQDICPDTLYLDSHT